MLSGDLIKNHYADVLMEMCEHRDLCSITVSDLTKAAGGARQTFYRHFADIYDVTCFAATRTVMMTDIPLFSHEITRRSWSVCKEHPGFFRQLSKVTGPNSFRNVYTRYLKEMVYTLFIPEDLEESEKLRRKIQADFHIEGYVGLFLDWCDSGMEVPVDTMIEITVEAQPAFIREHAENTPPSNQFEYPR